MIWTYLRTWMPELFDMDISLRINSDKTEMLKLLRNLRSFRSEIIMALDTFYSKNG